MLMQGRRSFAHTLPELGEPLGRDGDRSLELLGVERNAQLLEQPAELLQLRGDRAMPRARSNLARPGGLERGNVRGEPCVARGIGAQLVEPQGSRLEVAGEMLEPRPRRARKPPGRQKARCLCL